MKISDTTNKNGFIQRYERFTQLGDGVVSGDSDLLAIALADGNEAIYDLTTTIMLMQDSFDWDDPYKTDYPIATTPLVAGQRDYQFDSISFLKLKRVDITYDGTNWVRAEAFDSASYANGLGNDTITDSEFSIDSPMYDPKAFGFWLYPTATAAQVTAGAKARIEFSRGHTEIASSDLTAELPLDRPFHDLVAIVAALKNPDISAEQYNKLSRMEAEMKERMIQHYAQRNEDSFLNFNFDLRDNYS